MKHRNLFLGGALLLSVCSVQGASPTRKGFDKLGKLLTGATEILSSVTTPEELPEAMARLEKLERKYAGDASLEAVLKLTESSCPANLMTRYKEVLAQQLNFTDAGKRLAMSGILRNDQYGDAFRTFAEKLKKNGDESNDEPVVEGAPYETKEQRDRRMQWWRDGKFGMFIHYGLYSGLAGEVEGKKYQGCVEWIQMQSGMDSDSYAAAAMDRFNPKSGKAAEWVKLAKDAGCTYTVLTSRHHEGYNMFDTRHSDFNVKKTKGVDVVDEYAKACREEGIKAGYYVSLLDWAHPDYDPTGSGVSYPKGNYDAEKAGKRTFGNHARYKEYLFNLFDELTTKYTVDLVWWDFSQPNFQGDKAWGATRLMKTLFEKNPAAIQNNRLYHSENHLSEGGIRVTPTWKGDYSTAEHHIPATGIDGDWEACQTLNGTWGYSADNQQWKSSEELIRELIDVVSRGGNFLLNIGPEPDGSVPAESVRLFREIGAWMNVNNDAIYGTRANPFDVEFDWGRVTRKGDDLTYLLIYNKPEGGVLTLPCLFGGKVSAEVLGAGKHVETSVDQIARNTSFDLTDVEIKPGATVIRVSGKREL